MKLDGLFDHFARDLASPMPRRRALKHLLGGLAGAAAASIAWPGSARAVDCPEGTSACGNVCCSATQTCCGGTVCCGPGERCQAGKCRKLPSPSAPGGSI